MKTIRYAAFGSNLHPLRLAERLRTAELVGTRGLPGWSLHFHKRSKDGSAKCSVSQPGNGVHFAIYDIESSEKAVLDGIEGLGAGYDEITIDIPDFGPCYTYQAADSHVTEALRPFDWYADLVILGCQRHRFPQDYVDMIRSIRTIPDPDERRRRHNQKTVDMLRNAI